VTSAPGAGVSGVSAIGRSLPLVNAREKVTGAAQYVADLKLPNMLHAKILRSSYPHARLVHVDVERARRLPGVKLVLTGADTPKPWGVVHKDEHVLAVEKVRFIGEEIAAVVAVDENIALDALELIRVEYDELPAVFDPEAALAQDAPLIHAGGNVAREIRIERGDVDAGFRAAAVVHEATYETSVQYQAAMEPNGVVAAVDGAGRLTVWAPVHSVHRTQQRLADVLDLPTSRIRVIQTYVGGSFGGKLGEDSALVITATLAFRCRRPVRLVNTRVEDFQGMRPRMPVRMMLKMGVKADGEIVAKETAIFGDNGAYTGLSGEVMLVTAARLDSLYRQTNVRTHARLVYTNNVPSGGFRGFGVPQMAFPLDSHMDALAEKLGMDPIELRLRNVVQPGDTTVHGWEIGSCELSRCLAEARKAIGWDAKRAGRTTAPAMSGKRRGVGVGCSLHVSGARQVADWDGSTMIVKFNPDGRAVIVCGEGDIGQGGTTVLTQIAAEVLGIPPEHITVTTADTDVTPFVWGPVASRLTFIAGNALIQACRAARAQILDIAGKLLEAAPDDLVIRDGVVHVAGSPDRRVTVGQACAAHLFRRDGDAIFARASWDAPTVVADKKTFRGNVSAAYSFAVQAVEVEVDIETGAVRVVDLVAADDVGRPLNPMAVEGQIAGAIAQGMGYAMYEELVRDRGRLLNGNLADYTVPTAASLVTPRTILVDSVEPNGPFGAKGGSEAPISPTAGAIANAVYDAVGVRITSLPITPEKILRGLRARWS
jgi:CO/xanthine dehydrogenase Mo-binding subunit